ncbi:MAG: hypothetical protein JNM43_11155, partial [Planctomycetaceae bacterium]|nr:hypothetical protein [Planctomycetaceae bacterium]
ANVVRNSGLTTNSFTLTTPLVVGGTYRAWIRAISVTGEVSIWSNAVTFTVARIDEAQLRDPLGNIVPQIHLAVLESRQAQESRKQVVAVSSRNPTDASSTMHRVPASSEISVANDIVETTEPVPQTEITLSDEAIDNALSEIDWLLNP